MNSPYNLRCKKRNNKLETISCLKKVLKDKPIHEYNPEVRLERLKLLKINKESCAPYLMKNIAHSQKISTEKSNSALKYVSVVVCWSILIIIGIYLSGDFKKQYLGLPKGVPKTTLGGSKSIEKACFEKEIKDIIKTHLKELEKKSLGKVDGYLDDSLNEECKQKEYLKHEDFVVKDSGNTNEFLTRMLVTDYALESKGAKIVSILNTKSYGVFTIKFGKFEFEVTNFFLQKLFRMTGPTSVLVPWTKPGDCWAFKGSYGAIVIELSEKIFLTGVSIDHVRSDFLPENSVKSAPKNFSVIGFFENSGQVATNGVLLGSYAYNTDGPVTQTFVIRSNVEKALKTVQVTFESNHGNEDYTCVYKIRVHGHA